MNESSPRTTNLLSDGPEPRNRSRLTSNLFIYLSINYLFHLLFIFIRIYLLLLRGLSNHAVLFCQLICKRSVKSQRMGVMHCLKKSRSALYIRFKNKIHDCEFFWTASNSPIYMLWFKFFSLVQILFFFVSNSLSYITMPQNKRQ